MERLRNWKPVAILYKMGAYLQPMEISIHGAYTSFFLVLSVFPILVVLFSLLGYTSLGIQEVMHLVEGVLPAAFCPMAERLVSSAYEHTSAPMLSVSVLTALWSAGRGIKGLMMGLNSVYGLQENRGYFRIRGISTLYTFLFLIVLVLTLVLHVFGSMLLDYLRMRTDPVLLLIMSVIDLRFVFLVVLQVALFTAMYAVMPNSRHTIKQSIPGAVLAACGWMGFSDAFSKYVEHFPSYANVYGSVYAAALAMLWLYCCISIVFYGGALNRWLMERKERKSKAIEDNEK